MIHLDYRDPRPIYEQVYDALRNLIVTGVLTSGEKLPSVRELAGTLAINPNTIQRAYRELEADGYLCSVPGKGSFASGSDAMREAHRRELLERFAALRSELRAAGVGDEELIRLIQGGGET